MYFKAELYLSTEKMALDGDGLDPDSWQDIGLIGILQAPTLAELKKQIESEYFSLEKPIGADVQIFDGAIEINYEGEHHYSTPKAEQIPFFETVRIIITQVEETTIDLSNEPLFSKVNKS